jgi:hypothetical protein
VKGAAARWALGLIHFDVLGGRLLTLELVVGRCTRSSRSPKQSEAQAAASAASAAEPIEANGGESLQPERYGSAARGPAHAARRAVAAVARARHHAARSVSQLLTFALADGVLPDVGQLVQLELVLG